MIDRGVSHRYAHALFGAAVKLGALETVLADLEGLEALLGQDPTLLRFLESPQQLDEAKEAVVRRAFEKRTHDLFVRLLLLLLRKKRIAYLLDVVRSYRELVEEHQGVAEARVTTAVPLAADLAEDLRTELERIFSKKVKLRPRVDPRIIGGILVMIEGKIIDRSIRREIERLREDLLDVRVN